MVADFDISNALGGRNWQQRQSTARMTVNLQLPPWDHSRLYVALQPQPLCLPQADAAPAAAHLVEGSTKKLWGGRFTGKTDPLMEKFNESLPFDRRMWAEDIRVSAFKHAPCCPMMLASAAIALMKARPVHSYRCCPIKECSLHGS